VFAGSIDATVVVGLDKEREESAGARSSFFHRVETPPSLPPPHPPHPPPLVLLANRHLGQEKTLGTCIQCQLRLILLGAA